MNVQIQKLLIISILFGGIIIALSVNAIIEITKYRKAQKEKAEHRLKIENFYHLQNELKEAGWI